MGEGVQLPLAYAGAAQAGNTKVMVSILLPSGKVTPSLGWAVATATVFIYSHLKTPLTSVIWDSFCF